MYSSSHLKQKHLYRSRGRKLQDEQGALIQVPHLLSLLHPSRTVGPLASTQAEIMVAPNDRARELCGLLQVSLAKHFEAPDVEVIGFTPEHLQIRIRVTSTQPSVSVDLYAVISATLAGSDFTLLSGSLHRS